jgi:acyl-coenzyme A thioesterase 13
MVDLGGSLAVASRGLFATGVSTDLSGMISILRNNVMKRVGCVQKGADQVDVVVTYLASGGKIGDIIRAEVTCDKCTLQQPSVQFFPVAQSSKRSIIVPFDANTTV